MYGVGKKFFTRVQSFYVNNRVHIRVDVDGGQWFLVNVGLRQGCVLSPWYFNVYMDGVVQRAIVRMLERVLELVGADGGWFEINQPWFSDDAAPVADQEEKLLLVNLGMFGLAGPLPSESKQLGGNIIGLVCY